MHQQKRNYVYQNLYEGKKNTVCIEGICLAEPGFRIFKVKGIALFREGNPFRGEPGS